MELLLEVIISIIFEGSVEGMKEKSVPMWLRIICGIIAFLAFSFIIVLIAILAVSMWDKYYHLPSILFLIIDLLLIIFIIKKFKNIKK